MTPQFTVQKYRAWIPVSRDLVVDAILMRWSFYRGVSAFATLTYPMAEQVADRKVIMTEIFREGSVGPKGALPA